MGCIQASGAPITSPYSSRVRSRQNMCSAEPPPLSAVAARSCGSMPPVDMLVSVGR